MKNEIIARVSSDRIDILTKLLEAYDNLGIVSTINQRSGTVCIRVTPDTWDEMLEILRNLPFHIEINPITPV